MKYVVIAGVVLSSIGCGLMKNRSHTQETKVMSLAAPECKDDSRKIVGGSRGIVNLSLYKDYFNKDNKGKVVAMAKAFVTKSPLPANFNPYTGLGETTREPRELKLAVRHANGVADLGGSLEFVLSPELSLPTSVDPRADDATTVNRAMRAVTKENKSDAEPVKITLAKKGNAYATDKPVVIAELGDKEGEGLAATVGTRDGGIRGVRSALALAGNPKVDGLVLNPSVPGDIEPDDATYAKDGTLKAVSGQTIEIPVKADVNSPDNTSRVIALMVRTKDHSEMALCTHADVAQDTILKLPAVAQDSKGKSHPLAAGTYEVSIYRGYMQQVGDIWMDTRSGLLTTLTVEAAK